VLKCLLLLVPVVLLTAADRKVAITFDDLPRGGDGGSVALPDVRALNERLLRTFRDQKIPITGFVNEGRKVAFGPEGLRQILDLWLDYGADLGNHTYSHPNIDDMLLEQYTRDIVKGEPVLRAALAAHGKTLRYFRHPYLHTGPTPLIKQQLQAFLDSHGYRVAPITFDTADWEFASLYTRPQYRDRARRDYVPYMESVVAFFEKRAVEVTGREFPQILLVHVSELNADAAADLLAMFRRRGYSFVSLDQALADEVYRLPDSYAGTKGFSWIHRWGITKGMPEKDEPQPPEWVEKARTAR
jgi:peptidoglycan-N-acetylglucosamine deacetylase